MFWYRNLSVKLSLPKIQSKMAYQELISKRDQKEIDRLFARFFSGEDGKKVLAYLQHITFFRAANANLTEADLRHMEGQRTLLSTILRLIDRGRIQ